MAGTLFFILFTKLTTLPDTSTFINNDRFGHYTILRNGYPNISNLCRFILVYASYSIQGLFPLNVVSQGSRHLENPFDTCLHGHRKRRKGIWESVAWFKVFIFCLSWGLFQSIGVSASVLPVNIQDWFPLGWTGWISAVQGTLKGLLQHHSSKPSILQCSAFFIVQLSHPYMITGKTIALTRQTSVGKVMSPLFNMLSRLGITFLPRSKHLLISWLQSPSAVIWC